MYILIDDKKTLSADIICRNPSAARLVLWNFVTEKSTYVLGIDFDLGCNETGLDILKWAWRSNLLPDYIQIVSFNPVGIKQIVDFLICDADYETFDNINFIKNWR